MRHPLLAPPLFSTVDTTHEQFVENRADVLEQLAVIDGLLPQVPGCAR